MPEESCKAKLDLSDDDLYINCGVILYNVKRIKEKYTLNSALEVFAKEKERFTYVDQCFLNLFYKGDIGALSPEYNDIIYRVIKYTDSEIQKKNVNDIVIHFVGNIKPWKYLYNNKMYKIYWKYARKVYGDLYYFRWLFLSKILLVLSPVVVLIKRFRKVNI